jgi:hypothetical protein
MWRFRTKPEEAESASAESESEAPSNTSNGNAGVSTLDTVRPQVLDVPPSVSHWGAAQRHVAATHHATARVLLWRLWSCQLLPLSPPSRLRRVEAHGPLSARWAACTHPAVLRQRRSHP